MVARESRSDCSDNLLLRIPALSPFLAASSTALLKLSGSRLGKFFWIVIATFL